MSGLEWLLITALGISQIVLAYLWLELRAERKQSEFWERQEQQSRDAYTMKIYGHIVR